MGLFDFFKRGKASAAPRLLPTWREEGVLFAFAERPAELDVEGVLNHFDGASTEESLLGAYLSQLVMDGDATLGDDGLFISWGTVFELLKSSEHSGAVDYLGLPAIGSLKPILTHDSSLSNPDFEVRIDGWVDAQGTVRVDRRVGAVAQANGQEVLLGEYAWRLADELSRFSARSRDFRTQHENELGWGRLRALAHEAGAFYASPYLETTIVLTPQSLRLPLSKVETQFGRVVTVAPTFEGAPDDWLKTFDGYESVQNHYDLTQGGRGRVRVVISEPVRRVLEVIKRDMPGRKVAGARAEKFVHNPWAFLGDTAREVIKEEEFEQDKAGAGALSAVFSVVPRLTDGRIERVDLVVTETFSGGMASTDTKTFKGPDELAQFVATLETALMSEREWFPWDEYDLTIDAESSLQVEQARQVLCLWRNQPAERISLEDIYEMSVYSERIEGIGEAKAIYVPVFQKPSAEDDSGWLPTDLTPMVRVTLQGHEGQVLIPLTKEWVTAFAEKVEAAAAEGHREVSDPLLPAAVELKQAKLLADSFLAMLGAKDKVRGDQPGKPTEKREKKETLLVKTNFHAVDYAEEKRLALELPPGTQPILPSTLRPELELKKHQLYGVAWFQHLWSKTPVACRGALLADDMGLGKTLQLLTLLGWYYEKSPDAAPSLILAPKSLMENWENESKKFFNPSYPEVLVLYGDVLAERKQPLGLIDEALHQRGVTDLLRPGWVGSAKILVTTYEVLTNYEFSFARQQFSFVICDEAQRIKTPGTQVTLAAKKLKAHFRIACTGTPVENSLADLWCLFDFVQPGLLGALEDFGKTYRRPIECETEEQRSALERLKALIAPQILRRTKADIADLLPKKLYAHGNVQRGIEFKERLAVDERLEVPASEHQRVLYKGGLKKMQDASSEQDSRKRARLSFGALHLMKAVCAEPYCLPGTKFLPEKRGLEAHLSNSPKLRWLLDQLEQVKVQGEKAIIFTELREIQSALYYFLRERFGIMPFIINGDSQGRQRYIDKFSGSPGFDVIILSTLAAGAGLNITAANHVFHFTRAWNPAKENQATDRAYRIGQQKDVSVYCPTLVADDFISFEVRLDELLKRKAGLADVTIDGDLMTSMLNGTGGDVPITEFVASGGKGTELPRKILTIDDVDRMDGFGFEVLVSMLWAKQGFQAFVTPKKGGDGGIDVVALKGRVGELIQCKSSVKADVGWDAVKEVFAGAAKYRAMYAGTKLSTVAVTNQRFTSGAVSQAEANRVRLVQRSELEELLASHPVVNLDFDAEVFEWAPKAGVAA
ncbi:SNF2-related protein [Thauera sp. SWB20]|uniref:SNF2-related protein n=1 Tax=Thauera sp. SWB20 TaxID=1572758 RepID=UPI0005ADE64C|nr:SNF2-related protein [Thauera sp. SWB20]KIN89384.1 restriction endonuclease family protein [Thauera sp. SWB20]